MPWLLLGGLLWPGFYTMVQFDLLLAGAVLLALIGLVRAWQGAARGWWWMGLGIGLGVLAKGPVVLLHVLPVALLAPWWARERRPPSWPRWYGGLLLALALGAAIGLAWAWPAALAGGEAYRQAIFFGQHAGRMGAEAPHAEPWWLYLALLPVMLAPWSLWPRVWQGLGDPGARRPLAPVSRLGAAGGAAVQPGGRASRASTCCPCSPPCCCWRPMGFRAGMTHDETPNACGCRACWR
jgi:4-amino-4-deoxy-L-arabinose transferase-like glycosyltransferase